MTAGISRLLDHTSATISAFLMISFEIPLPRSTRSSAAA
jgi:hypothetical protein